MVRITVKCTNRNLFQYSGLFVVLLFTSESNEPPETQHFSKHINN